MIASIKTVILKCKKTLLKGRINPVFNYSISFLLTLLIFIPIGILTSNIKEINPFIFFIIPIILASWYGGKNAGLFSLLLSSIGIGITLLPDFPTFLVPNLPLLINFIIYIFIGLSLSYIIDAGKRSEQIINYEKLIDEYTNLNEKLDKNYKKAIVEIKARDEFLAIASHELKTPVTSMILQVQTALHNIRNVSLANFSVSSLLQMLDSTEQQSKRLSKMVNDLLNTSLITTGKLELELEEIDLTKIAKDVSLRFSEKLKNEHNSLIIKADKQIVGKFDKLRIEQVIANLLSNAIKYGSNKPIHLTVSNSNSRGTITIKDQGIGIPREQQDRIFKRFARAVTGNEFKGLGVGLYITEQIVKAHKGKIYLDSKPGKGTTFKIELPLNPTASKMQNQSA